MKTVKRNQQQYKIPLKIVSYKELYGWTMDEIVKQIGLRNNCFYNYLINFFVKKKFQVHFVVYLEDKL